ncbi:LysR substrate-binding domain-containing protein [Ningiella sp. W23]|uniref:LysR family transcriptional regulator n=1 Tax=Ningiella sp. W23 TaxID=3023715 RepID=UPI0037570819
MANPRTSKSHSPSISYKNMCAFVGVASATTFAEAAALLCLSQPALSTSIKNMEVQLGGKLFSRSTRKVTLTPEGQAFLPVAKRLIDDWNNALTDVQDLFSVNKGRLTVASMPSFAEGRLANILQDYRKAHPNIMLRVLDVVMEQAIEAVRAGRADLGFVFEPETLQNLQFLPLLTDNFCVVMPKKHLLAKASSLSLEEVYKQPMVAMNQGSSIRKWVDEAFITELRKLERQSTSDMKNTPSIVAEASQLGTLGQLVKTGIGLAIVPQLCQQQMLAKSLVCVELRSKSLCKRVGVIAKEPNTLSRAAHALWSDLSSKQH